MKLLVAAAAALALAAPPANVAPPAPYAGDGQPANSHPHIEVIARPIPEVPSISGGELLHVYARPKDWHLRIELLKWTLVVEGNRVEGRWVAIRGTGLWNIRDLPKTGESKLFYHEWPCGPGIFILELVTDGISDTGHYSKYLYYWPFANWKSRDEAKWKFNKPPTLRQAFRISARGDQDCFHSHGN